MNDGAREGRVGLLGGTFNPIHLGHLRAAEEVREALALDRILFIPSAIPPHKRSDPRDPIASASQRLEWVERAIAGHDAFRVDRIEIDRPGPSYLVDTLAAIRDRDAMQPPPVFIVGVDAFAEMGEWRAPERIFALTDLAVMTRPPGQIEDLADRIPGCVRDVFDFEAGGRIARHREAGTRIDLVPITALDISSSKIREARRRRRSIRFLVPESIRESIEASGCYARSATGNDHGRSQGNEEIRAAVPAGASSIGGDSNT
jgi:nicotinate-nucleotide adenylyltransferase